MSAILSSTDGACALCTVPKDGRLSESVLFGHRTASILRGCGKQGAHLYVRDCTTASVSVA